MRKIILSLLGVLLIIAAFMLAKSMIANKQKPKPRFSKTIKTVFIEKVTNKEIPIVIKASGNLVAKNKIELFSEVQGVLHTTQKDFKAGVRFSKNETLLNINSDEFYASLQSQKSIKNKWLTPAPPGAPETPAPRSHGVRPGVLNLWGFEK